MGGPIVVTVDDFFQSNGIDEAAERLARAGIVNRVAAFVTDSRAMRRPAVKGLAVDWGLHLSFTHGRPVLPASEVPSLVDLDGLFRRPIPPVLNGRGDAGEKFAEVITRFANDFDARAHPEELHAESLAQLKRFQTVFGKAPRFLAVHHDLDSTPVVSSVLRRLPKDLQGRRNQVEDARWAAYKCRFTSESGTREECIRELMAFFDDALEASRLSGGLPVEVAVHPSVSTEGLEGFTTYKRGRVLEYHALCSADIRALLRDVRNEGKKLEFPK